MCVVVERKSERDATRRDVMRAVAVPHLHGNAETRRGWLSCTTVAARETATETLDRSRNVLRCRTHRFEADQPSQSILARFAENAR